MPRFRNENGVDIQLTPEEETARDAEEQAWTDGTPLRVWENGMAETDKDMPRYIEDVYDGLDEAAQGRVPQITQDRITAKKTLRGEKP